MKRSGVILLVVFAALLFAVIWKTRPRAQKSAPDAGPEEPEAGAVDASLPLPPAIADRGKRDELRRKILAAWASGSQGEEAAKDAKEGRFEEHPDANGEGIDPKFVQATVREQLVPMVRDCYEEVLSRQPDAGGQVDMWFKIVADDKLGGLVEEDEEHDGGMIGGTLSDEKMQTCVRESLLTVTFPPPAHGGVVTVGYPIVFAPGDDDEDAK